MLTKLFSSLFLLLISAIAYSQEWVIYNTDNSPLPHDRVNQIKQDGQGHFWIGTNNGLAKFDGVNWEVFTSTNSSLPLVTITDIAFDGNIIWLGTQNSGIVKYDGATFTEIDLDDIFNTPWQGTNNVKGIDVDKNHHVWIATANGLVKYDGASFMRYTTDNGLLGPNNRVWSVKCDTVNDIIFLGTFDEGLQKFENGVFSAYYLYDPNGPLGGFNQVNRILFDAEGDIWVSGIGVAEFDKNTLAVKTLYNSTNGLGDPLVWGIAIDSTGKLWVGSDCLAGVFCLDDGTWITYNETNSGFPEDICYWVYNFAVDHDNNILMAHGSKGVIAYRKNGVTLNTKSVQNTKSTFNVYPNPAQDKIYIDAYNLQILKIEIYNIMGECVIQKALNTNKHEIDMSMLASGVYVIKATGNGLMIQQKLIKN